MSYSAIRDFVFSETAKIYEIESGISVSHKKLLSNAEQIYYYHNNINQGDIVTVVLNNSIKYIEYFIASIIGGWVFNPLPYYTEKQEIVKILNYINPKVLITDRVELQQVQCETDCPFDLKERAANRGAANINKNTPAALYYSSGTTGSPKGVLYSHFNISTLISSVVSGFSFTKHDKHLSFLPFGHTASINYNVLPALMTGADLFISKGFENIRNYFFEIVSDNRITYTQIVPTILFALNKMNLPILDLDLTSLRFIGCGSSSLPMASQMEFMKKYLISVSNLYGLSETGPTHIDNPERENWTPGSIGEPLSVNKCKIANDGEILIKGSNVFIGYYKNSNLYNQVITDEWFHTGDLGKKIGKKYYFIERKKDLIIKGGVNIVPMEVEEELYKHCNTKECAVVAINNELYGEDVCAIVVKKSNKDNKTMTKELKMLCRENLSNNKVPMHIFYVDKMPTTHSGKIMRREVRNMAEAIINNK